MQNQNISYHFPLFIQAMLKPEFYDHPVNTCQLIETHISWVILTGNFVYKIKKPIDLGFVNFSTLEKRKFYCEEELRLNRRLAPNIYLDVIPISGSAENPELTGKEKAFEYTVKMQQFSQDMQLDHVLARNELRQDMIDSFADLIAKFHQHIEIATITSDFGKPEQVYQPAKENFIQIRGHINDKSKIDLLSEIEQWTEDTFNQIKNIFTQRKQKGFIRECHGDLHLRNLAWYENKPLAFDCLEFNPNFRWIDVVSEISFLIMDLEDHEQPELAQRFLNRYLELTGDYEGCSVLRFYLVYRAMVRAKVDAIRAAQTGISQQESDEANKEIVNYLQLALTYTKNKKPFIIITHGMSASGKSTITQSILEKLGAIRIRADVERKRLFNIKPGQDSYANVQQGIYTQEATHKTYFKLLDLTESIIDAEFPVIVDATFSTIEQRKLFKKLATQKQVRFIILNFIASEETLKQRIRSRTQGVSDADINILENQIQNWQPIEQDEKIHSVLINTEEQFDIAQLLSRLKLD
ncbi:MAG: bifunctional aminoglycoside phosphotransferase/ATP-binding protein [Gammaproteobacteria bacterium]|nr:MAG: bifunctional aminoglycoside phosphotransferase/ATP-binding protein [Gammaproteobacteria bacterium]